MFHNAREKFFQKRTWMISTMNDQISDYLKSEKKNENLHKDLCAFIILHRRILLLF
jgi:hypothetical protein